MKWVSSRFLRNASAVSLLIASIGLAGCQSGGSILESDKIDYRSTTLRPTLEIPPDLTRLNPNNQWVVDGAAVLSNQPESTAGIPNVMGNVYGDVTMRRDGDRRWLVVERAPDQIWSSVEDFWQDLGFVLSFDEPGLGIMETDWAENRAKIPQDFIRRTLGSIFDSLYSTGERDKFRTRMEVTAEGTEIYITHRGVEEVYSGNDRTTTVWQPRASDPELEAEMLRRLMVRLGVSEEQSRQAVAQTQSVTSSRAQVVDASGQPVLRFNEDFSNAWRWVGIALDRISFTVVDRDISQGVYKVRYVDPVVDTRASEQGLLSGLFGGRGNAPSAQNFQIKLASSGEPGVTHVFVLDEKGQPVSNQIASRILNALAKDLN